MRSKAKTAGSKREPKAEWAACDHCGSGQEKPVYKGRVDGKPALLCAFHLAQR